MGIYAISDLHGYPLDKFKALLDKAGFSDSDTLFVLGDVIDRNGDGGVSMLRYMMKQPNIEFILGNHEDMLLKSRLLFDENEKRHLGALPPLSIEYFNSLSEYGFWMQNGGSVTLGNLKKLQEDDPNEFENLMDYLEKAKLYSEAEVNGRCFLLVHGGLPDFSKNKKPFEYSRDGLLWERPELTDEYYDDIITVLGHTPTAFYGNEHRGKVIKTRTWINIDTGCSHGLPPTLLRLDDLSVFYGG